MDVALTHQADLNITFSVSQSVSVAASLEGYIRECGKHINTPVLR